MEFVFNLSRHIQNTSSVHSARLDEAKMILEETDFVKTSRTKKEQKKELKKIKSS